MKSLSAVAVSGAYSSGKSHLLRLLGADPRFAGCTIFEMDSLRFWRPERQTTPEQVAEWFSSSAVAADPAAVATLAQNVAQSPPKTRTVKLAFCQLCASGSRFITVNPKPLRNEAEEPFFRLLRQVWNVEVHHIAILPSIGRYALNVLKRRDRRWRKNLGEILRVRRSRHRYALVARNRVLGGMAVDLDALAAMLALDRDQRAQGARPQSPHRAEADG